MASLSSFQSTNSFWDSNINNIKIIFQLNEIQKRLVIYKKTYVLTFGYNVKHKTGSDVKTHLCFLLNLNKFWMLGVFSPIQYTATALGFSCCISLFMFIFRLYCQISDQMNGCRDINIPYSHYKRFIHLLLQILIFYPCFVFVNYR